MGGLFKCNCGNSFDTNIELQFHRNSTHLASTVVALPKILWKRKNR